MYSALIETFVLLVAVIDPIGTLPVFIVVSKGLGHEAQHALAYRAVAIATGILLGFIIGGQLLLDAMHVPLSAFQVAGGIVLFLFALSMIFGQGKPASELAESRDGHDAAIFPLAVPSIASPGAMMAVVLLTDNARYSFLEQTLTTLVVLVVLAITLAILLLAPRLYRWLGNSGASIVSRVMGLVLCSVAASHVLAGIKTYFAP